MTQTITILPQYTCQSDFPLDFAISQEKANAAAETTTPDQKITSLENTKPPSFWISKYKENENAIHGKVNVIFNKGNEVPSLDAKPEFNVNWIDSNSFEIIDNDEKIIMNSYAKNYKIQDKNINSIDISPLESLMVTGEDDSIIKLVEIDTGNIRRIFEGHFGDITKVRFFPSGQVLLTAATDLQIKIWSVLDGSCPVTLKGHTRAITDTAIISRGRNVLSSSKDGSIRLWECGSSSTIRKICQLDKPIHKIALGEINKEYAESHPIPEVPLDSREVETRGKIIFAITDNSFYGYDLGQPDQDPIFVGHQSLNTAPFSAIAYDNEKNRVYTGNEEGIVALWDLNNLSQPIKLFKRNNTTITSLHVINKDELLVSQSDGQLYICEIANSSVNIKKEFVGSDLEPWYDTCVTSTGIIIAGGRNGLLQKYIL
ncbi:WD40 repeat-like protein [Piromyces finnis]|uniref:WD40 repeat-like protein n=1 Tax=Piromyces finnis TaxID=1754191 RepID=A0A1Y1VKM0_9FUNG|nr:WD40 repeat-like protein [Piromyces finnis]|eukprot:ORX58640.1 WD40 repeat-like protein [Piromyces finnis]